MFVGGQGKKRTGREKRGGWWCDEGRERVSTGTSTQERTILSSANSESRGRHLDMDL